MAKRIALAELVGDQGVDEVIKGFSADREVRPPQNPFTDVTGFHVYGELRLTLRLSAAEEAKDAQRFLLILQEYAAVADLFASQVGAQLLEVQGERIHLLVPCETVDATAVGRLLTLCSSLTHVMYDRVAKRAGDAWQGFAMAADHGLAILVKSGNGSNTSVVSLGPAANAPAKRLPKTPARHLSVRQPLRNVVDHSDDEGWADIDLIELPEPLRQYADLSLTERLTTAARSVAESFGSAPVVRLVTEQYFDVNHTTSVREPLQIQVVCLRADLDGFSAKVQAAFNAGEHAIAALVDQFYAIMRHVQQYCAAIKRKVISLPWAGDCSNHLFFPLVGESYATSRQYLPATAAAEWHDQISENIFGTVKWAVGVAGGDDEEGSDGFVLVANLKTGHRDFLVAVGWGVRRSLDAQEADGVKGKDSVMPVEDYQALDSVFQAQFRKLSSLFWISNDLSLSKIRNAAVQDAKKSVEIFVPQVSRPVPSPKPHSGYDRS